MSFSLDQFSLAGKVAIVTGAGGRGNSIGRAYALGLASAGAKVVVADLNKAGAELVAAEISALGKDALPLEVDITSPESVAVMAQAAINAYGGVDILINNAALMAELVHSPASVCPPDEWNRVFDVNLRGALNCAQAVIPSMRERGGGKIINQVSAGAFPCQSVYGITKLALVGLTTTLATELGRDNIAVNAIAPGNTMSDAGKQSSTDQFKQFLDMTVVMRPQGQPDELVGPLLLLCSPAGDWITGQVLNVDGGWVLRP